MASSVTDPARSDLRTWLLLAVRRRIRYTSPDKMPKRAKPRPARPVPVQLPLFPEAASLARIRQHIALEQTLGFFVLGAVALLGTLEPAHLQAE